MEDKDIELIEEFNYNFLSATRIGLDFPVTMYIKDDTHNSIMKLLQTYKQDEKVINEMAKYIDFDKMNFNCGMCVHDGCQEKCIIDYFRKKCE